MLNIIDNKTCSRCQTSQPLGFFPLDKRDKGGIRLSCWCKKCWSQYYKEYREKNKDKINLNRKQKRHSGEYKSSYIPKGDRKYKWSILNGIDLKERRRFYRKMYKYNKKMAGELTPETIRLIYENNIKKWGELTCYLCLTPIANKKENLEHKVPLSRGGTNAYENLDIACERCNKSKKNKTVNEYNQYLIKKGVK